MRKKNLLLMLSLLTLTILMLVPNTAFASPENPPRSPYELIWDRAIGMGPYTVDGHLAYDGGEVIWNIYETLIYWEGEPYDVFVPMLATQVWVAPPDPSSPPYTNYTVYFKIRIGVPFHNRCRVDEPFTWDQYYLTTEDVEYSFERGMVHDYVGSAQWMIFEPLLRCYGADPTDPTFGDKINNAVQRNATHVWLNIANPGLAAGGTVSFTPVKLFETESGRMNPTFWTSLADKPIGYPLKILFQVLSEPWFVIFSKQWIVNFVIPWGIEHGLDMNPDVPGIQVDWDGDFSHWKDYHGWAESPIDKIGAIHPGVTCGTGPYILDRFDPTDGGEWSVVKFDDYWGGWPATWPSPPYSPQPSSGLKPAGYVTRLTVRQTTFRSMISEFLVGDCDFADIPRPQQNLLHVGGDRNGPTLPGIRLQYPLPIIGIHGLFFGFNVSVRLDNKYGKIYPENDLHEDGIPCNFFSDVHVRKAFAYLINYTLVVADYYLGEAYQPVTCAPTGLPYVNPYQPHYTLNIEAAINELNQAFGGRLKDVGFTVNLYYHGGWAWGGVLLDDLAARINALGVSNYNGKFHASSIEISWSELVGALQAHEIPAWISNWNADYADIHNFIQPVMHSLGYFASFEGYKNPEVDELINRGLSVPDGPQRQEVYYRLQEIYYNDVPSITTTVPINRVYTRTWVQGQYYSLYWALPYAYNRWKWEYLRGNVNYDDKVFMDDILVILDAFGSYFGKWGLPVYHPRWNFHCDIPGNPRETWTDGKIDMYDITAALDNFGKTQTVWQPPP
jgi:peptide/nickel transport system substrate-binding protein